MKEPTIKFYCRLPVPLHERLQTAANERVVSPDLLTTKALEQFLDALIPVEQLTANPNDDSPNHW